MILFLKRASMRNNPLGIVIALLVSASICILSEAINKHPSTEGLRNFIKISQNLDDLSAFYNEDYISSCQLLIEEFDLDSFMTTKEQDQLFLKSMELALQASYGFPQVELGSNGKFTMILNLKGLRNEKIVLSGFYENEDWVFDELKGLEKINLSRFESIFGQKL